MAKKPVLDIIEHNKSYEIEEKSQDNSGELMDSILKFVPTLEGLERTIIEMRYLSKEERVTFSEIGRQIGRNRTVLAMAEKRAFLKIRKAMRDQEIA